MLVAASEKALDSRDEDDSGGRADGTAGARTSRPDLRSWNPWQLGVAQGIFWESFGNLRSGTGVTAPDGVGPGSGF